MRYVQTRHANSMIRDDVEPYLPILINAAATFRGETVWPEIRQLCQLARIHSAVFESVYLIVCHKGHA